jgi:hypothetical protein
VFALAGLDDLPGERSVRRRGSSPSTNVVGCASLERPL